MCLQQCSMNLLAPPPKRAPTIRKLASASPVLPFCDGDLVLLGDFWGRTTLPIFLGLLEPGSTEFPPQQSGLRSGCYCLLRFPPADQAPHAENLLNHSL